MKIGNNGFLPIFALIISTISIASAIVFIKLSEVDATSTLMLRMFFAGAFVSTIAAWPSPGKEEIEEKTSNKYGRTTMFGLLILSGAISTVDMLSNHWAVRMTSLANTSVLMSLSPVFVALIAFLFMKERIGFYQFLALSLCVSGACLVLFDGGSSISLTEKSVIGSLLALNSALFYAIYLVLVKSLRNHFTSRQIIVWNSLTCAFLLLPIAFITSPQILPHSTIGWLTIILLALISQLLGHGLMAYALKHVDVGLASISTLTSPIIAILFGFFIFDEKLNLLQWGGVAAVLIGVWWYRTQSHSPQVAVQAKTLN